jgi:hypothetical protein
MPVGKEGDWFNNAGFYGGVYVLYISFSVD